MEIKYEIDLSKTNLSLFRLDNQSLTKVSFFSNFREKTETIKNKGISNFISPNSSKFIRILSRNSFEIVSFFQKLNYPSKKTEKIFFNALFLCGFNFLNLFIQSNYVGPRLLFKKTFNITSLFFIDYFGLDIISRNYKISFTETKFIELFSLSKGILLETLGKNYQKCVEIFGWVLRFLKLHFKSIDEFPLKYRWGILFLSLFENFECDNKKVLSGLFFSQKNFDSNFGKWNFGLYDEFLYIKALSCVELFFFCSTYSRTKRIKYLLKAKYMICYKIFLSGFMDANVSHQLHFSPQNVFSFKINDNNDCIGEILKTQYEKKSLSANSFSIKRLELQTNRNCDFLNQKKDLSCFTNLNFFQINERKNSRFPLLVPKINKQPFVSLKLGYSIIFFLNLGFVICYSVSTSMSVLFRFFGELTFHDLINFKKFSTSLFAFSLKKKEINCQQTKILKICGTKLELFLKHSLSKKKKNIFLNNFWNLNCIFLIFKISSCQKMLADCYSNFGFFVYSKIIAKYFKSKKIFYKNLFFIKDSKTIEIRIRKFNELVNVENTSFVFFLLGNFTKINKYFEIMSKREFPKAYLAKQILGSWFCEKKKWIYAKKQISLSVIMNPKNKNALFELGFVSLKTKDFLTAARSFLKIIQEEPWNKYAWINLSSIFSSNFKKKDICYIFLKEAMKNKKAPMFIFKKFLVFCLNPKKLKLMNVTESLKNVFQQKIKKKTIYSNLFLKILTTFIEIFSKKFIIFLGGAIENFNFFKIFWDFSDFESLIYQIKFEFFIQNGFLKYQFNYLAPKNQDISSKKKKNTLNSRYYQKTDKTIGKTFYLFFFF